ncbi:MAG: RHS repeat-associated core domain-containing protein [Armatimonadota bacterium]
MLIEDDGTNTLKYAYGDDLLKVSRSGEYYYFYDGLGSTRTITDASGVAATQYVYDAYGELIADGATWNNYLFTGQMLDRTTGLYYLRARWYDPQSGRFVSRDTFIGDDSDPASLHRFVYCGDDPIDRVDPTGHDFSIGGMAAASFIGATLGGISSAVANYALGKAITFSSVIQGAAVGAVLGPLAYAWAPAAVGLGIAGVGSSAYLNYEVWARGGTIKQKIAAFSLMLASVVGTRAAIKYSNALAASGKEPWMLAGKGSTGRCTPENLSEQLAMEEVLSNPAGGESLEGKVPMTDDTWPQEDGWIKMQYVHRGPDSKSTTIHYVHQKGTNIYDDFKFK